VVIKEGEGKRSVVEFVFPKIIIKVVVEGFFNDYCCNYSDKFITYIFSFFPFTTLRIIVG